MKMYLKYSSRRRSRKGQENTQEDYDQSLLDEILISRLHPRWAALYVEKGKGDTPKACGKRNKGKKEKEKKERKKKKENYQNTI